MLTIRARVLGTILCGLFVPSLYATALTAKSLKPFEGSYDGTLEYAAGAKKGIYRVQAQFSSLSGGVAQFSAWPISNPDAYVYFDLMRNGSFKSNSLLTGFEYKVPARGTARVSKGVLLASVAAYFYTSRSGEFGDLGTAHYILRAKLSADGRKLTVSHVFNVAGVKYIFRYKLSRQQ